MKKLTVILLSIFLVSFFGGSTLLSDGFSQTAADPALRVELSAFSTLAGSGWTGTLSYLDYSKKERHSIPVKAEFEFKGKRTIRYGIQYPGESHMNSFEKIKLSRSGDKLDGKSIVQVNKQAGVFSVTTLYHGKDDNKKAEIRTTYTLQADSFVIAKDVKFDNSVAFFNRSEYVFKRGQL